MAEPFSRTISPTGTKPATGPKVATPRVPASRRSAPSGLRMLRWGPADGAVADNIVFLCHGMGSNAGNMIQIAPQLASTLGHTLFVAPDGLEEAQAAGGRRWFDARDRSPKALEAGVRAAAAALGGIIEAELAVAGLAPDAYALLGYSQGAMTVLFAGLRRRPPPRAILSIAGALIAPHTLPGEMTGPIPVLLVHGLADPVVPAFYSRDAEKALRAVSIPVTAIYPPRLGHGIDASVVQEGRQFLGRWLGTGASPRPGDSVGADG